MTSDVVNCSYSKLLDRLPFGVNEGAGKLILYHMVAALVMRGDAAQVSDDAIQRISRVARKIHEYSSDAQALRGSFGRAARRYSQKGMSIVTESSTIFAAAAVGGVAGGPLGSLAASTTATFPQSFGHSFVNEMRERGYDIEDPAQFSNALRDEAFVRHAWRASYIYAGQMSGAVLGAGLLAGYVYGLVTKPVARMGESFARTAFSRVVGEITDKTVVFVGDLFVKAGRSAVDSAGQSLLKSPRLRAALMVALVSGAPHPEDMDDSFILSFDAQESADIAFSHNRNALYL